MIFVVHNKLKGEKVHGYSIVPDDLFKNMPKSAIFATEEVEDKPYSKDEAETIRKRIIKNAK